MNVKYLINRAVREYPDKTAVVYDGARRTFREFDERVNALANGLLKMGVRKGDRVGMLLTNRPEFIEIDFALAKTGIVRVPLNARLTGADHRYMLDDSEADLLIFGEGFTEVVKTIRPGLKTVKRFIRVSEGLSRENIPGAIDYEQLIGQNARRDRRGRSPYTLLHIGDYREAQRGHVVSEVMGERRR